MTTRPRHLGQSDDDWSMPFGDSIYTHAPESVVSGTGSASTLPVGKKGKKLRRIGFKPPKKDKHD